MFCPHCGEETSDAAVFCDSCGKKIWLDGWDPAKAAETGGRRGPSGGKRFLRRVLALLLILAITAGGVFGVRTLLRSRTDEKTPDLSAPAGAPDGGAAAEEPLEDADQGPRSVSLTPAAALRVSDAESARAALQSMQAEIGFQSMEEFSEPEIFDASAICAYSFTQYVEGLPVEGCDLRLIANRDGEVLALLSDYIPPENVRLGSAVSLEQAKETVLGRCPEGAELLPLGKVICRTGRASGEAAWKLLFLGPGEPFCCYVSAGSGQVLDSLSLMESEAAAGSGTMPDGQPAGTDEHPLTTNYKDGIYVLESEHDRIRVMDAKGLSIGEAKIALWARHGMNAEDYYEPSLGLRNGELFTGRVLHNGEEEAGHTYAFRPEGNRFVLLDNDQVSCSNATLEIVIGKKQDEKVDYFSPLTDEDNVWDHPQAVSALSNMEQIHGYYENVLQRRGYGGDKPYILNVYVNMKGSGGAAACNFELDRQLRMSVVEIYDSDCCQPDVLGHEFAHAVIHQTARLGRSYTYPEASALNEGLADIMGECVEAGVTGSCNWNLNGRDLRDPANSTDGSKHPGKYLGPDWTMITSSDPATDNSQNISFAHVNCTVIGHLGYLMATCDLENTDRTEALGEEKLAKLIYATFPWLKEDTGLDDYAGILYQTAVEMYRAGELNAQQLRCVYRAIRQVGLFPTFSKGGDSAPVLLDLRDEDLTRYRVSIRFLRQSDIHRQNPDHYSESYSWEGEVGNTPQPHLEWPHPDNAASLTPGAWGYLAELTSTEDEAESFQCFLRYYPGADAGTRDIVVPFLLSGKASVACGDMFVAALLEDGTVLASGRNNYGQCEVDGWTDVVALSAGSEHLVGLREDGTVLATGWNHWGQCEVSDWTDIVAVSAGSYHTVGLRADGTVVAAGDNRQGECEVAGWTDIVAVAAGANHTLGLRANGTVLAVGGGSYEYGQCDVSDWRDIVAIAAGGYLSLGLKADGTVVATGMNQNGECDVEGWTDITAIASGGHYIDLGRFFYPVSNRVNAVGLRADGTVCIAGVGYTDQHETVEGWTDIVAIDSSAYITAAVKADGTLLFACDRTDASPEDGFPLYLETTIDVSSWRGLRTG